MKKFLSSILVFTIALTSFSAVSCFASEHSFSIPPNSCVEIHIKENVKHPKKVNPINAKEEFLLGCLEFAGLLFNISFCVLFLTVGVKGMHEEQLYKAAMERFDDSVLTSATMATEI